MSNDVVLRKATTVDVPALLDLIHRIAEYERLSHEVEATEALLRTHGFGPRPIFEAVLAERSGRAVGYALYFFSYSSFLARPTLYIEDIFVLEARRRSGIGFALFRRCAEEAAKRECGRMEWSVLTWNREAIDFYERLGARRLDEWQTFRLDAKGISKVAKG